MTDERYPLSRRHSGFKVHIEVNLISHTVYMRDNILIRLVFDFSQEWIGNLSLIQNRDPVRRNEYFLVSPATLPKEH